MTTRILVVEDDRILAMGLQSQLHKLGYDVPLTVASGELALEKIEELKPQLVLMDIQIEGAMDGIQTASFVRGRFRLPVIFLTAFSTPEVLERAKLTEPYGYVLKPYEDRELHIVIEMALYKHRAERKLVERERWFSATLRSMGDGVVATDTEGRVRFLNRMAERLTGWGEHEAKGKELEEVFPLADEETGQTVESPLRRAIREGISIEFSSNTVLIARDCTTKPLDDSASPIFDDGGHPLGGVMVFRDVTLQRAIQREVSRLTAIVASAEDAIIAGDFQKIVTSWNGGAERLFGYTAEEIIGQSAAVLVPVELQAECDSDLIQVAAGGRVAGRETVRLRKDGQRIHVLQSMSPVLDRNGRPIGVALIAHDISHTKQLEEQFRQAQKMEAIGRLAGGIAHDFNNLLTVINGYASVLLMRSHEHDPARDMLDQVYQAGEKAAALTRQLLIYSRKQISQPSELDLNELLMNLERMLGRVIGEDIDLGLRLGAGPQLIRADPNQLEQVVMNLAVNARDAMPGGGQLTIETAAYRIESPLSDEFGELPPGDYVLLAVTDTGHGMDRPTMSRIFEPFFTTKGVGEGTGLGLATVYGAVKEAGGQVRVYSEVGRGTTFKVYLPRTDASGGRALIPESPPLPPGTESVLLVEDEPAVRRLAAFVLERAGYRVLQAANGEEALAIARHTEQIDLLITDVVMPRMGGRDLVKEVRLFRPTVAVLYLSGYTEETALREGGADAKAYFLQKPFTVLGLGQKVRQVLDER